MKTVLTIPNNSLPANKQNIPKLYNKINSVLSSSTVYALLVFILLNLMLLMIDGPYHRTHTANNADDSLIKLHRVVFNSSYETHHSGPWPWWAARAYLSGSTPDIVILGDSQVNAAIIQAEAMYLNRSVDCAVDRQCFTIKNLLEKELKPSPSHLRFVNLGIGGAMPSDFYVISKSLFTKKEHPKLAIITVSPRSFLDATLPCASSTEIFQFFSPYIKLGKLTNNAFSNPVQKYFWIAQRKFTLFACRKDIELSTHELLERLFYKLYPSKSNLAADPSNHNSTLQSIYSSNGLVPAGSSVVTPVPLTTFHDNKLEYSRRFSQMKPETLKAQSAFLSATLKYLNEIGTKVVVINMPILQPVKALLPGVFWDQYRLSQRNNCQNSNAIWFDLDDCNEFSQNEFLDYVHLNAFGGKHFVERIASFIKDNKDLRTCLQ